MNPVTPVIGTISNDGRVAITQHSIDQKGLTFVKNEEGEVTHVYKDQVGKDTIGIGHLITPLEAARKAILINRVPIDYTKGLTEAQCYQLLDQDMDNAERAINTFVKVALNENQFDALASWTFNCGVGALQSSTLLRILNQGDYGSVPAEFNKWTKADGQTCPVLVGRRKREVQLWLGQI